MSAKFTFTRDSLELLAESMQAMAAFIDTDQCYVFANPLYTQWFGLEPSEIVGRPVKDVLGKSNYAAIRDKIEAALAGEKVSYVRDTSFNHDAVFHFQTTYIPHYDDEGRVLGFFLLAQNVDHKNKQLLKKTHIDLQEISDARTTSLINNIIKIEAEKIKTDAIITAIGDGISIQDKNFKILYQNDIQKGYAGEHEGNFCYKAYENNDQICPGCPVKKSFQDGKIHKHERVYPAQPDITYEITSSPIRDNDGNIFAAVEVIRDITDRQQTEHLLQKTNLELEQILNTVEHGIALIDINKRIIRVNQSMLDQSNLTEKEVLGLKCHDIFPVTACNSADCPLQKILAGDPFVQLESERHRRDGSRFPCEITAKPLLDTDGNLIGMVQNVRDITGKVKRKQDSEHLRQQAIHAEKLASLGTVVAGVAHEINNPNSFISYNAPMAEKIWQGVTPVLEEYAAQNPQWKVGPFSYQEVTESMAETLQFIKTGADRINGIVTSLKDFAGRDQDQEDVFIQVNTIINQAHTIIGAQLRKKVGTITLNLAENLPEIYGQFQRVEQVVVNLMLNAMDAIDDKKTGHISVTTKYNECLQTVLITVEDNGKGIKKEVMDLIFDPFFTTRRDKGGTGLGLAVSFGLIKDHHGTISVLSLPGQGTRFSIFLPIDKRLQEKIALSPSVLCVDDDQQILQLFKTFFSRSAQDMHLATRDNPADILAYINEHPEVELVFSDVMMPNINGWDLLAQIKTKFPLMPVVLFSADPTALEQRDGFPSPDYIVHKPFTLKDITAIIQSIDRRIV